MPTALGFFSPDAHGHLGPRRASRAPPVGDADDQPGRLEGRDGAQEAMGLGGRPGHRLVDRARVDELRPATRSRSAARCNGHQEVEQRLPVAARGGLLERAGERAVLHLAADTRAHGVGGEEGERVDIVAAILGQVQTHLADDVPRGVARRAASSATESAMGADLVSECAAGDRSSVRRSSRRRRTRRRPSGGTAPASRARSSGGQSTSTRSRRSSRSGTAQRPRDERAADVAQECEGRSEGRVELGRAQVEQGVSGPAREGADDASARGDG